MRTVQIWQDSWKRLVQKAREVRYGAILDLTIQNGEPCCSKPVTVEYLRLLTHEDYPAARPTVSDVELKERFRRLKAICEREKDMDIKRLQIQDGLPHTVKYEREEML